MKSLPCTSVALLLFGANIFADLRPFDLRVEGVPTPVGVDFAKPRFSWKLESDRIGERQTAYHILVASTPALLEPGRADFWDSGYVPSTEQSFVEYKGRPLVSGQKLWWKVQVWGIDGRESKWSQPTWFVTGILDSNDWKAVWITSRSNAETLRFRRVFALRDRPSHAVVFVSGLGHYQMFINGTRVGDHWFTPGWTSYQRTVLYDTYEVTDLLRRGTNVVCIEVAPGMYHVLRKNRFSKFTGVSGPLCVLAQFNIQNPDGTQEVLVTDEQWKTKPGPILFSSIYGGEDYDARLEEDWTNVGFDDSSWDYAVRYLWAPGRLCGISRSAWPVKIIGTNPAVGITGVTTEQASQTNSLLVVLSNNISQIPLVEVDGPRGTRVIIRPAEILDEQGKINQRTMGAKPERGFYWCEFVKGKDGAEIWHPKYWYIGCRYLQVELETHLEGVPAKLVNAFGLIVSGACPDAGTFECSDRWLPRIRDLVRRAQRSNIQSIFTDCPHREKLGWLEQCHINGPSLMYEFDLARNFRKLIYDMMDSQTEDGLVPNIAPEYTRFKGVFRAAAEWGSAAIIVPWQQFIFSGDTNLLSQAYPMMVRYFKYLQGRATNDLLSEGLGDWYDLGPDKPGPAQLTPAEFTASAFFFYDALILSKVATVLGLSEEAKYYEARVNTIRDAFNRRFFDPSRGLYGTGSQASYGLPLAMGIVPRGYEDIVLSNLVKEVIRNEYGPTAGDIGFRFVLRALADHGRSDVVYKMVTQSQRPGYVYQLLRGETSLTESWDANPTSSHNHFMLGAVIEWLYHDLLGIQPDENNPGFRHVIIKPAVVDDIDWACGSYESIRGRIEVGWEKGSSIYKIVVGIPPGTTATVYVWGSGPVVVRELKRAQRAGGTPKFLGRSGKYSMYEIPSGKFEFTSRL